MASPYLDSTLFLLVATVPLRNVLLTFDRQAGGC